MNKKINLIGIIIFILIIVILVSKNIIESRNLKKDCNYTIGTITGIEPNMKSGYRIIFEYDVKNITYKAFDGIYENKKSLIGKRFFVKYVPSNPKNCSILLSNPVPENVKTTPFDGWKTIPR